MPKWQGNANIQKRNEKESACKKATNKASSNIFSVQRFGLLTKPFEPKIRRPAKQALKSCRVSHVAKVEPVLKRQLRMSCFQNHGFDVNRGAKFGPFCDKKARMSHRLPGMEVPLQLHLGIAPKTTKSMMLTERVRRVSAFSASPLVPLMPLLSLLAQQQVVPLDLWLHLKRNPTATMRGRRACPAEFFDRFHSESVHESSPCVDMFEIPFQKLTTHKRNFKLFFWILDPSCYGNQMLQPVVNHLHQPKQRNGGPELQALAAVETSGASNLRSMSQRHVLLSTKF